MRAERMARQDVLVEGTNVLYFRPIPACSMARVRMAPGDLDKGLRFMTLQNDQDSLAVMKFGIGQPVPRTEDPVLVRGEGCYTDDVKLAGEAYAVMVRSRHAHGTIKGIDTAAARKMPGVLG